MSRVKASKQTLRDSFTVSSPDGDKLSPPSASPCSNSTQCARKEEGRTRDKSSVAEGGGEIWSGLGNRTSSCVKSAQAQTL